MMRYFLTLCWALLAYILTVSEASAGPVFVALMANGVAFGAALGATAVGAFMSTIGGRLLSSVALSALSRALGPKTKQNASGITTSQTATGGTNPVGFVLGKYATAGDAVCPPMTHGKVDKTPNAYLTYVIAVGDVAGQTLDRVAINGAWVDIAATVNGEYGNDLTGIYAGYAWVKYYDGTQTVADPMLRAKYGSYPERPWLADMIGTGVPYVIFTFRYNREVYTEFPSVLIESGGIKLYDPRKDTSIGGSGAHRWGTPATYQQSSNPIVMAYNVSRGITIAGLGVWGGAIEAVDLPTASWFSAMNTCDVTTGYPAVAQFRAGYEVRVNMEPAAVIEELFKGCAGEIAEVGGEFKVRVGGPGLPVMFLTDDDIVVSKAQDYDPFPQADGRQNGIDAKYPDPAVMWIAKSAPSLYNTAWETEDGERRAVGLDLPACPYPDQVQRIMAAYIADERRFRRHNMTLAPDAAILEPLDVISWTSARNSYTAKLFDLAQLADDVNTALQRVSVREVDAADFVFTGSLIAQSTASSASVIAAPQVLDAWNVQPLEVADGYGVPRKPGILMTWSATDMDAVEAVQYTVRVKDTGYVVKIGTVSDVDGGRIPLTDGIVLGVTYQAQGIPVAPGRATAWSAWVDVTAPSIGISTADVSDEGFNASVLKLGKIQTRLLEITELLEITDTGALSVGKDSAFDLSQDGIYFGRTMGAGGVAGFGLIAGKKISGRDQYVQASDQTGLKMVNASHFVSGNTLPTVVIKTATTAKTALPVGTKAFSFDLIGGGAEGWGVTNNGYSFAYQTGNAGGDTVVKLYDGTVLKATYTATGANNAGNGSTTSGQSSSLASGGAAGTSNSAATAGTLGAGGGGNYNSYDTTAGGGSSGNVTTKSATARGGKASSLVDIASVDLSGYAAPAIEIIIGAGGDGAGNGAAGGGGRVKYSYSMAVDIKADVVPLTPTATGSFSKAASVNGTFPNLGAGIWVLRTNSDIMLNIGNIQVTVGHDIWVWNTNLVTLISDKTPTWTASANARTIYYTFYSMGSWGA
jgi:hypothetical protein